MNAGMQVGVGLTPAVEEVSSLTSMKKRFSFNSQKL